MIRPFFEQKSTQDPHTQRPWLGFWVFLSAAVLDADGVDNWEAYG